MYVAVFVWNSSGNLEGHGDDWKMLREKTLSLARFDLEWWTAPLKPILDEFVRASSGEMIDLGFWQNRKPGDPEARTSLDGF